MEFNDKKIELTRIALLRAAHLWLRGELDFPKPDFEEGLRVVNYLTETVMSTGPHSWSPGKFLNVSNNSEQMLKLLNIMTVEKPDISKHFHQVANHRKWLGYVYDLWRICLPGIPNRDRDYPECDLSQRIKEHDLSKYGPWEALGYHYKFGKGIPMDEDSEEGDEWRRTLSHHYRNNDHHPQYFEMNRSHASESRIMSVGGRLESVMDMIACRLERTLNDQKHLCPAQIMSIPCENLYRYTCGMDMDGGDFRLVLKMMFQWAKSLENLLVTRLTDPLPALDTWERTTGFQLNDGKWAKIGPTELKTGYKILENGDHVMLEDWEKKSGYRNEAGDWVRSWQICWVLIKRHLD